MHSLLFAALLGAATLQYPAVTIMDIQGRSHGSPLAGDTVATTGVVVVVVPYGFYIVDPAGDGDTATSDGLFVYTGVAPPVQSGDLVRVEGPVNEHLPGSDPRNLTVTEIDRPAVTVLSSGHSLPEPVRLGSGGRIPPSTVIDDDGFSRFDPDHDGIDFYESVEGMRVLIAGAVAVSATNRFGEVWVVGDRGDHATGMNARGGITISAGDFNPERIQLDDALLPGPFPAAGAGTVIGDVTGVVGYSFGNYEVLPDVLPDVAPAWVAPDPTPLRGGGTALTVATFNVENLDGRDADRVAALAEIIVHDLSAPDVVALEEVQDDSGPVNDGTVVATATWRALAAAVALQGGPRYDFREVAPENGCDGGAPGANIRVGLLFRPDRIAATDRGRATAHDATDIVAAADGPALTLSPGRIDPSHEAWIASRKPLAVEMSFAGERFFFVVCHFSSRSGSDPLFGSGQPPAVERAEKRRMQAAVVRRFVQRLLAHDPAARIVVLGDFNDFPFSQPLDELGLPLVNLVDRLPAAERYTYNFEGNSQALDHILASRSLAAGADVDIVHCCAGRSDALGDHDPVVARFELQGPAGRAILATRPNPFRGSVAIVCTLPGPVTVEVFDVTGRRVRALDARPGEPALVWDGRDDHGAPVASGVYFLRAGAGNSVLTGSVVRVK